MSCPPTLDDAFGPAVAPCRRSFDFTLLFTETILVILPAGLFVLLAAPRLYVLLRKKKESSLTGWWWARGAILLLHLALQVAFLATTALNPPTHLSTTSAVFRLLPTLLHPPLSVLTATRTPRPDPLLTTYHLLMPLFTAAQTRTLFLSYPPLQPSLLSATLFTTLLLLVLESFPPASSPGCTHRGKEATASPLGLTLMTWLLPLITRGYRTPLTSSLLPPLPKPLSTAHNLPRLRDSWTPHRPLLLSAAIGFWRPLAAPVLPRLALVGFTFAQPFLVARVLAYLQRGELGEGMAVGWALMAAYALVYCGIAGSTAWYNWMTDRMMVVVRGGLVGLVWDKLLLVPMPAGGSTEKEKPASPASSSSKAEAGTDEKGTSTHNKPTPPTPDATSALTLMSTDTERIIRGLKFVHEPWANTIEAVLAIYLLTRQVGLSALPMVALALLCVFLSSLVAARSARLQGAWMAALQTRVTTTAATLGSLKAIKLLNLEPAVSILLQGLRDKEVAAAGGFRSTVVVSVGLSYATLIFSPVVVFGAFMGVASGRVETLDAARLFTSLTVIGLLAAPLVHLFQALPALSAAWGCAARIQEFLCIGELEKRENGTAEGQGELGAVVKVCGGAFGWGEKVLSGVDVEVKKGKTVMLLGPVGCGKSVLLKGLLGEVPMLEGSVVVSGGMAYCDQTPWLVNGSVRSNIVGPGEDEEEWYRAVVKACAIDAEISNLTSVGSGGVGLSGGQRQRVALARAIYSRRPVLLLDDVFSGLDRKTVDTILERLWGADGLLRRLGTTVVFATHGVGYLRYADAVIALGADGRIVEQGTREEVLAARGYVSSLLSGGETGKKVGSGAGEVEDVVDDDEEEQEQEKAVVPTRREEEEAEEDGRARDRDVYRYYFRSIGKLNSVCFLVGGVCFGVLLKFPDQWLTWWSNANATHPNERIGYYLGIYAMFNVLAFVSLCAWAWHLFHGVAASSGRNLHRDLLKTVMSAPFAYISRVDTGVTTNRFSQDMLLVDGTLPISLLNTAAELFTFLTQLALIAAASPFILCTFPPLLLITTLLQHTYLRTSKRLRLLDISLKSPLYSLFTSTTLGLPTIRCNPATPPFLTSLLAAHLDTSQNAVYLMYAVQVWLNLVLDLIVAALAVVVIAVAVAVGGRGGGMLSASAVGLALTNITTLGETLKNLVVSYTSLETSLGAIARLQSFSLRTPQELNVLPSSSSTTVPDSWPQSGSIEFRGVSASYSADGPRALTDVNLRIEAGERVAVRGRSGSGKSSLLGVLTGLLDVQEGAVLIDGVDVGGVPRGVLRRALNVVPQDCYFVPGSVRANLDPEGALGDEELRGVLERVELGTVLAVGDELEAGRLSAGQRQLVGLGRAVVRARVRGRERRGGVLVLDEAMSSVDVETGRVMERVVAEEFVGWTVVSVVHRGGLGGYGRVLVMDGGRIIGDGSVDGGGGSGV